MANNRGGKNNPRYANGNLRRKHRARIRAMALPCAICGQPIDYDAPSDARHPRSFVIDEIVPVSRYKEAGYASREQAAQDWNNLQAVHYACNSLKSAHTMREIMMAQSIKAPTPNEPDGEW